MLFPMSHKMSPSRAFPIYFARIRWLTSKIENCDANGLQSDLYRNERAALFWFADKLIEQAKRLAERQEAQRDSIEAILRQSDKVARLKEEVEFEFQSDL
jgi:hypothetical protein